MATTAVHNPPPPPAAAPPPPPPLTVDSIPSLDLRFLSQSDLLSLARLSATSFDLSRLDDVVIPKLDKSVFNESAGSRKQTFSRLRLANPNTITTNTTNTNVNGLDFNRSLGQGTDSSGNDVERAENVRIVSLLKKLFNSESIDEELRDESKELVPIGEYGEGEEDGIRVRKRGRSPKGETGESTEDVIASNAVVVYEDGEEKEKELVNRSGDVVDLVELGKVENPYGEELRRRTEGLKGDEELLGFMSRLGGQWGSRRRRRRIVDANELGGALPNGWKVIIAIKKKQGNEWLFCRRYISPKGRHFATCKEISLYLMSLHGLQDMNTESADQQNATPLEQQTAIPPPVKKPTPKFDGDTPRKVKTPRASFATPSSTHEKPLSQSDIVYAGIPSGADIFKCHKCSTPYAKKEGLLHHLLSCHKRKRRKAGEPMVDEVLASGGKYECQFCDKTFTERHCYFAHVGIHVKMYEKSILGSSGTGTVQNSKGAIDTSRSMVASASASKTPHITAKLPVISLQKNPAAGFGAKPESGDFNSRLDSVALDSVQKKQASENQNSLLGQALNESDALNKTNELRKVDKSVDMSSGESTPYSSDEKDSMSDEDDDIDESSRRITIDKISDHDSSGKNDGLVAKVDSFDGHAATGMDLEQGDGSESEGSLSDGDSETTRQTDNVKRGQCDEGALLEDTAEPRLQAGVDTDATDMIGTDDCGVEDGVNGVIESMVKSDTVERGSADGLFDDLPTCEIETYVKNACIDSMKEPTMENFNSQNDESTADALPQTRGTVACKVDSFPASFFDVNQSTPENVSSVSPQKAELPKSGQGSASSMLFASGSSKRDGSSSFATHSQQENVFSSLGRQALADDSNVFETCDNILKDPPREMVSKSILSSLSVSDHVQNFTDRMRNADRNVNAVPAGTNTSRLPELDKIGSSMNNEVMLDFVGNMTEMNRSVLSSAQHGMISESSSPFSLWNDQSYNAGHAHTGGYDSSREGARQERARQNDSLSLAGYQQTYDLGYNLNKSYISSGEELSGLDAYDHRRDTDLMIGFGNNETRTNQHVATEDLWRSNDERVMPGGLGDSSSSHAHVSGSYRAFDILMDKGENELFGVNEKFDALSGFDSLRSAAVEPMEFSFLTGPNSSTQLEEPKVMSYNTAEMDQGFDSSLWFSKGTPNMMGGHGQATMCVWCCNTFHLDPAVAAETQAGSIGHLCHTCKDRMSGRYM